MNVVYYERKNTLLHRGSENVQWQYMGLYADKILWLAQVDLTKSSIHFTNMSPSVHLLTDTDSSSSENFSVEISASVEYTKWPDALKAQ
jgi:hypothetical protein